MWQQKIIDYLEAQERSQAWLARKARMDANYLSAILNGLRLPGRKVLGRLEKAMGLPAGTLTALRDQLELMSQGKEG
jgi:transcriptional regulator with XRE-family HTH domain